MRKHIHSLGITRFLFVLIALAAFISMVINTWSIRMLLNHLSIGINSIIIFTMVYLALFLKDFKQSKNKHLVIAMLFGVYLYLVFWNLLPMLYWIYEVGFNSAVEKSMMSPQMFIISQLIQFVAVPTLLYFLLRHETQCAFKENDKHMFTQLALVAIVLAGVIYLVIAAM